MSEQTEGLPEDTRPDEQNEDQVSFKRKKLSPFFVDDISNISISPNGACRLHFSTWNTDEDGKPVRVDSEVIMTMQSLKALSQALPQAIAASESKGPSTKQ